MPNAPEEKGRSRRGRGREGLVVGLSRLVGKDWNFMGGREQRKVKEGSVEEQCFNGFLNLRGVTGPHTYVLSLPFFLTLVVRSLLESGKEINLLLFIWNNKSLLLRSQPLIFIENRI